jgi:hypothetical protein
LNCTRGFASLPAAGGQLAAIPEGAITRPHADPFAAAATALLVASKVGEDARELGGMARALVGLLKKLGGAYLPESSAISDELLERGRSVRRLTIKELVASVRASAEMSRWIEAVEKGEGPVDLVFDRKLADRVGGSTKEIRSLIEDVRSAVNTTVMTTETGVKAADAGGRQFLDVASTFKQIQALVTTTTEASREIELSTKQQATAVEQVNVAIANVAQATREPAASSAQTLQTASQLAGLSRDMARLVQANTAS